MSRQIVGFFHNQTDAQSAREELLRVGFAPRRISVYQPKAQNPEGLWDEIRHWFGFASNQDRDLYRAAASTGAVGLLVDMLDEEVPDDSLAYNILNRHNPVNLEAQARGWGQASASGYDGPVPLPLNIAEPGSPRPGDQLHTTPGK
jgi:hypothetical protein